MTEKIKRFLTDTIWRMELHSAPRWIRIAVHPLRFLLLTVRTYLNDGSMLHASALTYITMLAIVPVLALGLTTLKSFGAGELAEAKIVSYIDTIAGQVAGSEPTEALPEADVLDLSADTARLHPPAETAEATPLESEDAVAFASQLRKLTDTVFKQIDSINFAKIGIIGAVVLIFMVVTVLGKIENSFNMIWGVSKARPFWRKCTDYLSVLIIVPMLFLAATSFPVLEKINQLNPHAGRLVAFIADFGIFSTLVPFLLGTLLLAFLFGFLPNTRIRLLSCLFGGAVTTVLLALFFKICVGMQIGIANNNVLYGSLVALPVLLFWIFSSWQIILFGAEICYVHQHYGTLIRESAFSHPSERDKIIVAIALVLKAAQQIHDKSVPLSAETFADEMAIPPRFVRTVADILERHRILIPVILPEDDGTAYMPARCSTALKLSDIVNACLDDTPGEAVFNRLALPERMLALLNSLDRTVTGHFSQTVADLLTRKDGQVAS